MVQWLGLCAFTAEGAGSVPGWGTRITQAAGHNNDNKIYVYTHTHTHTNTHTHTHIYEGKLENFMEQKGRNKKTGRYFKRTCLKYQNENIINEIS